MSKLLKQIGITKDNKPVLSGVFALYQTEGLPIDIIFSILIDKNCMPCWNSFYQEAKDSGMKHSRILSWLEAAIIDSYGSEFSDTIFSRLKKCSEN